MQKKKKTKHLLLFKNWYAGYAFCFDLKYLKVENKTLLTSFKGFWSFWYSAISKIELIFN